jgi:hypothetical protein
MTIINLEAFLKLADYKLTYIISGAFTGSEYWIDGDTDQFDAVKKSLAENCQDPYGPCVEDIYAEMLQRGMTLTVTDPEGGKHDLTIEHLERAVDVIFTKETEILKQYLNAPDMLTDCAFIDCAIFGEVTFG